MLAGQGPSPSGISGLGGSKNFIAKYIENDFMPLLAVGLALGYAGLAIVLGLSEILGAFLAGVMLSETGRSTEIERLLLPIGNLRRFFLFATFTLRAGIPFVGMDDLRLVLLAVKIVTAYAGSRLFAVAESLRASGFSMVQRGESSADHRQLGPAAVADIQWGLYS
ncbi:MAG: cation:proton antiporter [Deltaproteobacteria bacterium]|nr:cation:proton antiporter [Deltaproteobacteria bacterium]